MTIEDLKRKVNDHMIRHYRVSLDDLEQTDTPGYWQDKEAKMHPGYPLHGCLGCDGPFRATYTYYDSSRVNGRFASPTRTWKRLKEASSERGITHNKNKGEKACL